MEIHVLEDAIAAMYREGKKITTIAEECNVTVHRVNVLIKRAEKRAANSERLTELEKEINEVRLEITRFKTVMNILIRKRKELMKERSILLK